jgi:hypothetical protein
MYNLTDGQKEIAKWLVKNVKAGNLNENFEICWVVIPGESSLQAGFTDYRGSEDLSKIDLTQGSLIALSVNNLLLYQVKGSEQFGTWECTLTGDIYTAVDNDFNSPDTSFIKYLTPLSNPSGFDKELARRCFPILTTGANNPDSWDTAVRNAGVVLEERLHTIGSITDQTKIGRDLVNAVFGKNGTLASKFSVDPEREGYRELYSGIVGAFRNPSAHRFMDHSPEEGGAFIVFVNLLLKKLEDLR